MNFRLIHGSDAALPPATAAELAERWKGHLAPDHAGIACPDTWVEIVHTALLAMSALPDFEIHQVKEKFGGLRIYYAPPSPLGRIAVDWAEMRCAQIEREL